MKLVDMVEFSSGLPQARIKETTDLKAQVYTFYSQQDLLNDLAGMSIFTGENKKIRTINQVNTLKSGDILFSLISGQATTIGEDHAGYIYTQNYVLIAVNDNLDSQFLVYLLNENKSVRKQLAVGLQGSQVLKYTLKQLRELELPEVPNFEKQRIIGDIYFKQLKLQALKKKVAECETEIVLSKIKL